MLTQEEADASRRRVQPRGRALARRGCARHLVLLRIVAVLHPRLAGRTPELARYYPTDVLVTGFDIIFFWVARMMMMGLHFMKEVPFRDVYIHGLVRDERGAKMSKSKGNVIDPLDLIDQYGADALRFTLAAMAAQGRDVKLSTQRVEGYRNFATKLWNAARFAEMNGCVRVPGFDPRAGTRPQPLDRARDEKASREVTGAIEAYRFNDAAGAAYRFVWNIFCDWYLELSKPVLEGPTARRRTKPCHRRLGERRDLSPCILHAVHHRGAVERKARPGRDLSLALALARPESTSRRKRDRLGDRPCHRDPLRAGGDEHRGRPRPLVLARRRRDRGARRRAGPSHQAARAPLRDLCLAEPCRREPCSFWCAARWRRCR